MTTADRLSAIPPEVTAQFFEILAALERERKEKQEIANWLKESERVTYGGRTRMTNLDRKMEAHLDKKTRKRIDKLLKESFEEEKALEEASKDGKKTPTEDMVSVEKQDDQASAESSKIVQKAPTENKSRARKQKFPKRIPPTDEDK